MIGFVEAPITWGLVRGMARRAGLDVPRAVVDGWLTRAELARIVTRCQTADCAKGCMDVLAHPTGPATQSPPSFCAIKAELEALAPERPDA
ncbi:DUF6455 family protein [Pseudorhodobacter sp.]|uniref:DUF6455 family protein n=1 Tax=Pseudorhodobacter sp. TaxID=1934400 RepID=UPI002AFDD0BB|nr:DUF6455 family protein [Pseudorhodobacter sp.]